MGRLRRFLLGIPPREATFERRRFRSDNPVLRDQLERSGQSFLIGYHAALDDDRPAMLVSVLEATDREVRGFAFEGAGMGLAMLDVLQPWHRRLPVFLAGVSEDHAYMAALGSGWAIARLPLALPRTLGSLGGELRWLALNGWGFHEGYFAWPRAIVRQRVPSALEGYARRAFDQGLGRSLWLVEGGDIETIAARVAAFAPARRGDLWSGLGLACTYAGGVGPDALAALWRAAGSFHPQLAQGAVYGAKARWCTGNPTAHTELACQTFCGMSADRAADLLEEVLRTERPQDGEPLYETWRRRVQELVSHRTP